VTTLGAIALDVVAVALLGWTSWRAWRARERPSAWPFLGIVGTLTAWALFALMTELAWVSDSLASTVGPLGQIGAALVLPGVLTVYALSFSGRGTGLSRWRIAMLVGIALPVIVSGVILAIGLATGTEETAIERTIAGLLAWEVLYLFTLFCYTAYLLVGLSRRHDRVSGVQILLLLVAAGAPYIAGGNGSNTSPVDGVTVGLLFSGLLLTASIRRYPMMTGFPKATYVARTRVVEALQEAVVVLDWDDHVIDANATTGRLFDRSTEAVIGDPVRSVVDGLDGVDLSAGTTGTVTLRTTEGRRQFQYSVSAVDEADATGRSQASADGTEAESEAVDDGAEAESETGDDGTEAESETGDDGAEAESEAVDDGRTPVARAVVFRDVTDQQTREQRLAVLNRILRHNVRNELDVVLAHADRIDDEDLRAGIRDSATDLVDLGEKARDAEEIMTASTRSPEPVDLAAVVRAVADEYRPEGREEGTTGGSGGEVTVDCPDELTVVTHRSVVERVLSELVDNAVTHADGPSPHVEISLRESADGVVELSVADDGPGIPDRERRILAEGGETQLEHGTGIGLWFVNWAVTQLGGELEFAANEPVGSVVTVRLHGTASGPGSD